MKIYLVYLFFLYHTSIYAQEQTFAINRSTIFFNENGVKLSFDDFAFITSEYKNTLLPKFDATGKLDYITIRYPEEANQYLGENSKTFVKEIIPTDNLVYTSDFKTTETNTDKYNNVKNIVGLKAPNFSILDQYNTRINSNDLIGSVYLLKFWFSKCAPCIEEMPELNNLVDKYFNENIKFFAPSVERKELSESFLAQNKFKYNVFFEAQNMAALYKTPGYPTHVLIGKDGIVRKVIVGKRTNIYNILDEEIKRALLIGNDDLDVLDIDETDNFVINDNTIIFNEENERIQKEEYIYRLNTGRYKIYKKMKKNGEIHLLLTNKNE